MNPFEYVNSINYTKKNIMDSPEKGEGLQPIYDQ